MGSERGTGGQLMQILGLLGVYFVAAILFVTSHSLLFRLALAILCYVSIYITYRNSLWAQLHGFSCNYLLHLGPWNVLKRLYRCDSIGPSRFICLWKLSQSRWSYTKLVLKCLNINNNLTFCQIKMFVF